MGFAPPCPTCGVRLAPRGGGRYACAICGFDTRAARARTFPRPVEGIPLVGNRILLRLRSGTAAVCAWDGQRLSPDGAASDPQPASRRLKLLPRTDGAWIVFDAEAPLHAVTVAEARTLGAAAASLFAALDLEQQGKPLPVVAARHPRSARTPPPALRGAAPTPATTPAAPAPGAPDPTATPATPATPAKTTRRWRGCGHPRAPRARRCHLCVHQIGLWPPTPRSPPA